jgi:8-hydroxy-5-deazaflavin:NADPH oxidoreductase
MTTVSIIGSGNMATAIGTQAAKHGHTIELISRTTAKAQALADQIGNGATAGTYGATPLGDIVIVAVPYANAVTVAPELRPDQRERDHTRQGYGHVSAGQSGGGGI